MCFKPHPFTYPTSTTSHLTQSQINDMYGTYQQAGARLYHDFGIEAFTNLAMGGAHTAVCFYNPLELGPKIFEWHTSPIDFSKPHKWTHQVQEYLSVRKDAYINTRHGHYVCGPGRTRRR